MILLSEILYIFFNNKYTYILYIYTREFVFDNTVEHSFTLWPKTEKVKS